MIGEKIVKIMSEIKPIEKTELDEERNYKFAKSEEIISRIIVTGQISKRDLPCFIC